MKAGISDFVGALVVISPANPVFSALSCSRGKGGKRCGEIELLLGTTVFLWLNCVTVRGLHAVNMQ